MAKEIDKLPPEIRAEIDAALDAGGSPTEVWRLHDVSRLYGIKERTFLHYATLRKRSRRIERVAEKAAFFRELLAGLGVETDGLTTAQRIQLGVALHGILSGGQKLSTITGAIFAADAIRRTQLKAGEEERAAAKFAAWRAERDKQVLAETTKAARAGGGKVSLEEVARILESVDFRKLNRQGAKIAKAEMERIECGRSN